MNISLPSNILVKVISISVFHYPLKLGNLDSSILHPIWSSLQFDRDDLIATSSITFNTRYCFSCFSEERGRWEGGGSRWWSLLISSSPGSQVPPLGLSLGLGRTFVDQLRLAFDFQHLCLQMDNISRPWTTFSLQEEFNLFSLFSQFFFTHCFCVIYLVFVFLIFFVFQIFLFAAIFPSFAIKYFKKLVFNKVPSALKLFVIC